MDNKDKWELFKKELGMIRDEKIRQFAMNAIAILPDYFFTMAASTTAKYHPAFALGDGGLVRHTRAVVQWIDEFSRMEMWHLTGEERDLAIASALVHDGWKKGDGAGKWTVDNHPVYAVNKMKEDEILSALLPDEQLETIFGCVASHMGQWNTDKAGNVIMPKPSSKIEKLLHFADFCASRRIEVE